jgi:hypothetical protein
MKRFGYSAVFAGAVEAMVEHGRQIMPPVMVRPPTGSRFEGGVWPYAPALPRLPELRRTHPEFAAGYELCRAGALRAARALRSESDLRLK